MKNLAALEKLVFSKHLYSQLVDHARRKAAVGYRSEAGHVPAAYGSAKGGW